MTLGDHEQHAAISDADASQTAWQRFCHGVNASLRFYTRLPLYGRAAEDHGAPDFTVIAWATPIAGAIVGAIGAAVLALAALAGLPALVAAAATLAVMLMATGAFHEDGLADTFDSLGAYTVDKRLDVMRDSRVGTFGASALVLSLMLRAGLLAGILETGGILAAALALVAAESVSRAGALTIGYALNPARSDGASISAGRPTGAGLYRAGLVGALIASVSVAGTAGMMATLAAIACVYVTALVMVRFARAAYGGQTGDVAGATQQVACITFLVAIAIAH